MSHPYSVTLGALKFGDDEENLTPVVSVDCADTQSTTALASLLLKAQTGMRTMENQDEVFSAGDIAIKVEVGRHPANPKGAVLATVRVKLKEEHLTEAFCATAEVDEVAAKVFRFLQQVKNHYVLTVSDAGQPCCDLLYLVKYELRWTSPVESTPP